jgi:hypothetical protein
MHDGPTRHLPHPSFVDTGSRRFSCIRLRNVSTGVGYRLAALVWAKAGGIFFTLPGLPFVIRRALHSCMVIFAERFA